MGCKPHTGQGETKKKIISHNELDVGDVYLRLGPDPMPSFFRHTLRSRIQNLNLFWGPQKFLGASEAGKKKQSQLHHFFGKKKIRMNFLWDKLLEFLLFNEVLKKLDFFSPTNQKSWLYHTKNEQISNSESLILVNL